MLALGDEARRPSANLLAKADANTAATTIMAVVMVVPTNRRSRRGRYRRY